MSGRTTKTAAATGTRPMCVPSARDFYEKRARADFVEVAYALAPARIQAALREEISFLREALSGAGRALELGCGSGRLLEALGESCREWLGIDFLPAYLGVATERRQLGPSIHLAAGRVSQLPFAAGVFDAVLCAQSTFGLLGEEQGATLQEAARVSRPGGCLVFVVYSELSVVPRVEWYTRMYEQGLMAPLDWARSTPELLITADGHASQCFGRERLEALFRTAGLKASIERLGAIYWVAQAKRD